jgi:hypothetical protein
MQWRLHENVNGIISGCAGGAGGSSLERHLSSIPNARDFIDSFTAAHGPKAKLMYFYEILRSDDYKVLVQLQRIGGNRES